MRLNLSNNKYAIIDEEDFHYLSRFTWQYVNINGVISVRRNFKHKKGQTHINLEDYILPRKSGGPTFFVFKNGDRLDFRKQNLAYSGIEGITQKAKKMPLYKGVPTSSKYKGVSKNNSRNSDGSIRGKPWRVQIEHGKRNSPSYKIFVRLVFTEREAALLYNEKAIEWFGEHAYQNKVD